MQWSAGTQVGIQGFQSVITASILPTAEVTFSYFPYQFFPFLYFKCFGKNCWFCLPRTSSVIWVLATVVPDSTSPPTSIVFTIKVNSIISSMEATVECSTCEFLVTGIEARFSWLAVYKKEAQVTCFEDIDRLGNVNLENLR